MKRRSERQAEIESWLAVRERKGLTLRQLSEVSGIPTGTLAWWTHRLRQQSADQAGFQEIRVVESGPEAADDGGRAVVRVIHPGGCVVEAAGRIAEEIGAALKEVVGRWS